MLAYISRLGPTKQAPIAQIADLLPGRARPYALACASPHQLQTGRARPPPSHRAALQDLTAQPEVGSVVLSARSIIASAVSAET
jgi:hypothetical protein